MHVYSKKIRKGTTKIIKWSTYTIHKCILKNSKTFSRKKQTKLFIHLLIYQARIYSVCLKTVNQIRNNANVDVIKKRQVCNSLIKKFSSDTIALRKSLYKRESSCVFKKKEKKKLKMIEFVHLLKHKESKIGLRTT